MRYSGSTEAYELASGSVVLRCFLLPDKECTLQAGLPSSRFIARANQWRVTGGYYGGI